jgi:predicted ATPase
VLLLDDVHWADGASVEVIAHISRRFRGPLLVVLAFRHPPARLFRAVRIAARGGAGSRLALSALSPDEADILAGPHLDSGAKAALY